jgi:hypothetical protein
MLAISIMSIWSQVASPGAWLIGIRELAYHGTPVSTPVFVSFYHWRIREQGDYLLDHWLDHKVWEAFEGRVALAVNRRTSYVLCASGVLDIPLNTHTVETLKHPGWLDIETSLP